jgi:hypothetical protein
VRRTSFKVYLVVVGELENGLADRSLERDFCAILVDEGDVHAVPTHHHVTTPADVSTGT